MKLGTEIPIAAMIIEAVSQPLPFFSAAVMPSSIPAKMANTSARMPRSKENGKASDRIVLTGLPV
ncbi:hypothetical protein D3C81_2258110 [compost metagenome]